MAELIAKLGESGYYICEFIDEKGQLQQRQFPTAEGAIAKVRKYIEKYGGRPVGESGASSVSGVRGTYGKRTRKGGENWGRPTKARKNFEIGLQQLFGSVRARAVMAGTAAVSAASAKITEEAAKTLLENVYKARGNYNTYTGNLERAYKATIIQGRKAKVSVFLDDTPAGNRPVPAKRGKGLIVHLYGSPRHHLGFARQNSFRQYKKRKRGINSDRLYRRVSYRYFKSWELKNGYRHRGLVSDRGGNVSGFQYMAGKGYVRGTVQSGIILENTAPYAGAVAAKGYQVMPPGALLRSYNIRNKSKQQTMLNVITRDMLRAAKLI